MPFPLIGNTWEISRTFPGYETWIKWHKKYGPIFTYWLGEKPIVCVTNYDLIEETFGKDGESYSGRPRLWPFCGRGKGMEQSRQGELGQSRII